MAIFNQLINRHGIGIFKRKIFPAFKSRKILHCLFLNPISSSAFPDTNKIL